MLIFLENHALKLEIVSSMEIPFVVKLPCDSRNTQILLPRKVLTWEKSSFWFFDVYLKFRIFLTTKRLRFQNKDAMLILKIFLKLFSRTVFLNLKLNFNRSNWLCKALLHNWIRLFFYYAKNNGPPKSKFLFFYLFWKYLIFNNNCPTFVVQSKERFAGCYF